MVTRPCLTHRCPKYAPPGESHCAKCKTDFERSRREDPAPTGRRGTSTEWRRARGLAISRAKHRCQRCRRIESQLKAAGGRLEVHHIDGDPHNHRQSNLLVLCSLGCHRIHHTRIRSGGLNGGQ